MNLSIPKGLHDLHNNYPLAPDKLEIKKEMSDYQLKRAGEYNITIGNIKKLVLNIFDKEKYVLHYENFQFYLKGGLKFKKIHRVFQFKKIHRVFQFKKIHRVFQFNQSRWLKPYIEFNTHERIEVEKMVTKVKNLCTN